MTKKMKCPNCEHKTYYISGDILTCDTCKKSWEIVDELSRLRGIEKAAQTMAFSLEGYKRLQDLLLRDGLVDKDEVVQVCVGTIFNSHDEAALAEYKKALK